MVRFSVCGSVGRRMVFVDAMDLLYDSWSVSVLLDSAVEVRTELLNGLKCPEVLKPPRDGVYTCLSGTLTLYWPGPLYKLSFATKLPLFVIWDSTHTALLSRANALPVSDILCDVLVVWLCCHL